jgi:hypothetical protein
MCKYVCIWVGGWVGGGDWDWDWGWSCLACPYLSLSSLLLFGPDSSLVCSGLVTYHQSPAHKRGGFGDMRGSKERGN